MIDTLLFKDFNPNHDIFYYLNDINALPFDSTIITPEECDLAFRFKNNNKVMASSITTMLNNNMTPDDILKKISQIESLIYKNKWSLLYTQFIKNTPLDEESSQTQTDNNTENGTIDSNNTNTQKVSAYDSSEPVTNDINTIENSEKTTNTTNHTNVITKTSQATIAKNIELLQDNLIYDIIFEDIRKALFLSIY